MDDRKVNFALVLRSDKEGMLITFGWWRAEVVKHLGKFSHFLTFMRAAACILLMADSGIGSTVMTKWKEGTRYLLLSTAFIRYRHAPGQPHIRKYGLEKISLTCVRVAALLTWKKH